MKKLLSIFTIVAILGACTNNKTNTGNSEGQSKAECSSISVDSFLVIAKNNIGKEVTVIGTVNHICKHSAKRLNLSSTTTSNSIHCDASEQFGSFNAELEGSKACFTGIVVETKIDQAMVDSMEVKAKAALNDGAEKKECSDSLPMCARVKKYRDEIAASPDGYVLAYSLNVSKLQLCGESGNDGCGKQLGGEAKAACCEKPDSAAHGCEKKEKKCCDSKEEKASAQKSCCDK